MNAINTATPRATLIPQPSTGKPEHPALIPQLDRLTRPARRTSAPPALLSPLARAISGVSLRRGAIHVAQRDAARSLEITTPADPRDAAALRTAVAFLNANYSRFLPSSPVRVVVGDPGNGRDGATSPPTGTITLRSGMSDASYASTLAHELLHTRAGFRGRVKQNVDEMSGRAEEHDFIDAVDQAVRSHFTLEQSLGRPVHSTAELLERNPAASVVEYEAGGAPFLLGLRVVDDERRLVERHVSSWSAVRASFEGGAQ